MIYFGIGIILGFLFYGFRYRYITKKYNDFYDRITNLRLEFLYNPNLRHLEISTHEELFTGLEDRINFIYNPKFIFKWKWEYITKDRILMMYIKALEILIEEIKAEEEENVI